MGKQLEGEGDSLTKEGKRGETPDSKGGRVMKGPVERGEISPMGGKGPAPDISAPPRSLPALPARHHRWIGPPTPQPQSTPAGGHMSTPIGRGRMRQGHPSGQPGATQGKPGSPARIPPHPQAVDNYVITWEPGSPPLTVAIRGQPERSESGGRPQVSGGERGPDQASTGGGRLAQDIPESPGQSQDDPG